MDTPLEVAVVPSVEPKQLSVVDADESTAKHTNTEYPQVDGRMEWIDGSSLHLRHACQLLRYDYTV